MPLDVDRIATALNEIRQRVRKKTRRTRVSWRALFNGLGCLRHVIPPDRGRVLHGIDASLLVSTRRVLSSGVFRGVFLLVHRGSRVAG